MEIKKTNYRSLLEFKHQIILQGPPGTGKTYTAKDIAETMIFGEVSLDKKIQKKRLESTDQFKLIQFHPSYSYEDFVRGISAKSKGNQIEYSTENRIFGAFAQKAFKNYSDSQKETSELLRESWTREMFELFKESLNEEVENKGHSI